MIKTGYEIIGMIKDDKAPKKIKLLRDETKFINEFNEETKTYPIDLVYCMNDEFEIIEDSKVWKPKKSEEYFYAEGNGSIFIGKWENNLIDNQRYKIGNCFKTSKKLYDALKKQEIKTQLKRYAEEHNIEKIEWNDENRAKYFIKLYHNKWIFDAVYSTRVMHQVYFTSKELCKQAIEEIGEDNIKKLFEE